MNKRKEVPLQESSWKISAEEIERLRAFDVATLNEVYLRNIGRIRALAYGFCRKHRRLDFFDDCVNQVYVDFFKYDLTSDFSFFRGIYTSFYRSSCSSFKVVSLDAPLTVEGDVFLSDVIADKNFSPQEKLEQEEELLSSVKHLYVSLSSVLAGAQFAEALEYVFPSLSLEQINAMVA